MFAGGLIWIRFATVAATVVSIFAAGWHWSATRKNAEIAQIRATYAAQVVQAEQKARATETTWNQKLTEANDAAAQRETILRRDAVNSRHVADGLRSQLADANSRLSTATEEAVRRYARAADDALSECADRYTALAAVADQYRSDLQKLTDAWPK